ncbi:hypothetical protein, partial [Streptomyces sp. SID724]|uniref:hypothetical protein n=1 Tax=Streptomyces sp. SID724 TaxID=2690324 RepID=UPI001F360932
GPSTSRTRTRTRHTESTHLTPQGRHPAGDGSVTTGPKPARSRAVKPRLDVKTAKATDVMSWPGLFVVDAPAHEGIR